MSKIYFPILMGRLGEIEAASRLSPRAKARSRLMFDPLLPRKGVRVEDHLAGILQELRRTWGTSSSFYLDLSRYGPEHVTSAGELAVVFAHRYAQQASLRAIPVSGPLSTRGPGTEYVDVIRNIRADRNSGIAIRIPFPEISAMETLGREIDECLSHVGASESEIDLYLDYGAISTLPVPLRTQTALVAIVGEALGSIAGRSFRQVVVSGSNIPGKFSRPPENAAHFVPRTEMQVWRDLLPRRGAMVAFGDYGARYAYQTEPSGPVIPPSRAQIADVDAYELYKTEREAHRETCRAAARSDRFAQQANCWGKSEMLACGLGPGAIGTPQDWAARDTNLHIV